MEAYGVRSPTVTLLTFQLSSYPTSVTMNSANPIILFQMMLHYKAQAEQLAKDNTFLRDTAVYNERQCLILQHRLRDAEARNQQLTNGGQIVVRALDAMYEVHLQATRDQPQLSTYHEEVHRIMVRGDVGFAIIEGAPFVDLTAETELESDAESE